MMGEEGKLSGVINEMKKGKKFKRLLVIYCLRPISEAIIVLG